MGDRIEDVETLALEVLVAIERTAAGKHQDAGKWSPVGRQAERTGEYAIGGFDF
jgi:hypothetical protein